MIRDVSERLQAEARLRAYQEQLRSLTSDLALTEERERRRIAAHLGGSLEIDSGTGGGTRATLTAPLRGADNPPNVK